MLGFTLAEASETTSIQKFGVKPGNSPSENKKNLQKAIDWASESGAALWVEPSDEPYAIDGGIILKKNVSLIGVHGPTPRGTTHSTKKQPVGSVFAITDRENAFITVESGTQIKGIQFWYPEQTIKDPATIIPYPATIKVSETTRSQGVFLSCLTFYGEYLAFDFNAQRKFACELMTFEHCYGYPLSGEFIRMDYCYDVPRILHCHVNPAIQRFVGGQFSREVVDAVIAKKTFAFSINHTDNAQLMDLFTFGTYGGILLDGESYGQLTNFNFDCVAIGILKRGNNTKNRNWQIAQGSIIANTGEKVEDIHPIIIEGEGHTSLSNVEAFSGGNGALTTVPENMSWDYLLVRGDKKLTVSIWGARMRNYVSDSPISIENDQAVIQVAGSFDKDENIYNKTFGGAKSFNFDEKGISKEVLENYLNRSVTMASFLMPDHREGLRTDAHYSDDIRMIKNIGAKFIGRAIYRWGEESRLNKPDFWSDAKSLIDTLHAFDPEMVFQGCLFEIVTEDVNEVQIPGWVFEDFGLPVEDRSFSYEAMLNESDIYVNHWREGSSVPDISRLESQLWFYYLAGSYIDLGIEAFHLGQVELIGMNDPDRKDWAGLLTKIREYAEKHARRNWVLLDAHVPKGDMIKDGVSLIDFNSFPLRIKEIQEKPYEAVLEVNYLDALFNKSKGCITPSGWSCESLPYLVELDNYGRNRSPNEADTTSIFVWGWDEISWYAQQPESYRNDWLQYAFEWLRETDPNGHLQMPVSRMISCPNETNGNYHANTRSEACPIGYSQEETIKEIWSFH